MVAISHLRVVTKPESSADVLAVQTELASMQQIAAALGPLEKSSRLRVLAWAEQRFRDEEVHEVIDPLPLRVVAPPPVDVFGPIDETLSVPALDDLFAATGPAASQPEGQSPAPPIAGMLQEFVVEFQSIARQWSVACDVPAEKARSQRASSAV